MASSASGSRKKTAASGKSGGSKTNTTKGKKTAAAPAPVSDNSALKNEIVLIGVFALTILLFLCNFGVIGVIGDSVSRVMFGIFGITAYVVPVLAFVAIAFGISNQGTVTAIMKLTAGIVLFVLIGVVAALIGQGDLMALEEYSFEKIYESSAQGKTGGGIIAGSLAWIMHRFIGMVGTVLFILVLAIICMVVITEKSFVTKVKSSGRYVYETARSDAQVRKERTQVRRAEAQSRREEAQLRRREREQQRLEEQERQEAEKILRMDKKVTGVMMDTSLKTDTSSRKIRDDMHEITLENSDQETVEVHNVTPMGGDDFDFDNIRITTMHQQQLQEMDGFEGENPTGNTQPEPESEREEAFAFAEYTEYEEEMPDDIEEYRDVTPVASQQIISRQSDVYSDMKEMSFGSSNRPARTQNGDRSFEVKKPADFSAYTAEAETDEGAVAGTAEDFKELTSVRRERPKATPAPKPETAAAATAVGQQLAKQERENKVPAKAERPYQFPPVSLLHKSSNAFGKDNTAELKETAKHLQETLQTFGVKVTITDISQGPTVTRYELQPEQGVRVSKILSLQDDIKLNLAATDIRIEAPILGKSAVGIEVPNKETSAVGFRDLVESREFRDFPSNIAFAVGKDISGKVIVTDIAKMPHMLIAGATGSGKSVCINTLIMSILYKANPSDAKLILVDPKVVELSVYNGIPHLLIPVVTDPKKASAALQWAVAEMTDRYKKFADYNVRDLKGFNKKMEERRQKGEADVPEKMPQIVIIVDELADLMMVAPGEVEEAICRLAQLARACGIHLIIATQRPSVDVITGLIKANMPSRVAFAVSSGVDSRTILDMNGAEKLLGKGDMLFYPQGYSKPARMQGAFISDDEVSDVVDFLKNQSIGNVYSADIEEKLKSMGSASGSAAGGGTEYDSYFVEAGKFIIDKDKASIGMLQRVFKIGFNRAARIMDQLAEVGVVGEEEGTKPRKVLMTMSEFEQLVEEII